MKRPPTCDEAERDGLVREPGIHTFSNGSEWADWCERNCDSCRFYHVDVMGAACAFESAAYLGMATPELARLFGWVQSTQEYGPLSGWDAPKRCAFWHDKDDEMPEPSPIDPTQLTFLAPDNWPVSARPVERPAPVHA